MLYVIVVIFLLCFIFCVFFGMFYNEIEFLVLEKSREKILEYNKVDEVKYIFNIEYKLII